MKTWKILSLALTFMVAGCQSGPIVSSDIHTGNTVIFSSQHQLQSGLLHSLSGRAFHSQKTGYGVAVEYMSTGLGWAFLNEAWSFGQKLPFDVRHRKVLSCSAGCTIIESGSIRMSKAEFRRFAKTGFEFRLIGQNNTITGRVPASAFAQVLSQKQ